MYCWWHLWEGRRHSPSTSPNKSYNTLGFHSPHDTLMHTEPYLQMMCFVPVKLWPWILRPPRPLHGLFTDVRPFRTHRRCDWHLSHPALSFRYESVTGAKPPRASSSFVFGIRSTHGSRQEPSSAVRGVRADDTAEGESRRDDSSPPASPFDQRDQFTASYPFLQPFLQTLSTDHLH